MEEEEGRSDPTELHMETSLMTGEISGEDETRGVGEMRGEDETRGVGEIREEVMSGEDETRGEEEVSGDEVIRGEEVVRGDLEEVGEDSRDVGAGESLAEVPAAESSSSEGVGY